MHYSPIAFSIIVTGVGAAIEQELATTGAGPVNRTCLLVPGEIVWDDCECGQLAQSITSTFPANNFPEPAADARVTPCGPVIMAANVVVSVTRCVPTTDDNGAPPRPADLLAAAQALEADRYAVRRAVTCHLRQLREQFVIADFTVGMATTVGPNGGCAGVELPYTIAINNDCCG